MAAVTEQTLALKFRDLAQEGQTLGLAMERGQATSPLAEHFAAIQDDYLRSPLTVALVAFDEEARSETVAWLLGEDYRVVSMRVSDLPGLVEIRLSDQGYSLESYNGRRAEFDSLSGFLEALARDGDPAPEQEAADLLRSFKVSLAAAPESQGITLLLPESLTATSRSPLLANALNARSHLLLVAVSVDATPDADAMEMLAHLTEGIGAMRPVSMAQAAGHRNAWWHPLERSDGLLLAPVVLSGSDATPPFAPPFDAIRAGLLLGTQARRLHFAAQALHERHEQELRLAQARRAREERTARPDSAPENILRRPVEDARSRLQDDLAGLAKSLVDTSRRSLLPDGAVSQAVKDQLDALRSDDLAQETGQKMIRLRLSDDFQASLQRALRKAMKEELRRDLITLRDGQDALRHSLESLLETATGNPVSLALAPPSESDAWATMGELVKVEIRYRGEMPRRGFLQRLGEGRRAVFAVMMILSLVGSMIGFSWRGLGAVGLVFLLMFAGVVIHTYRAWKREDSDKLDGELDRVREQLTTECRRIATEVQREKQQRLGEQLEQSKRSLTRRLDELLRDRLQSDQEQIAEQRERARLRLRKLDQQLRDLQALGARIGKLRQDSGALAADAARDLRGTAQRLSLKA